MESLARDKGVTPAQLALAWVIARAPHIVAIPGTRSRQRLEENAAAAAVTFTADELRRLDEIAPRGAAVGTRYPEASMRALNL